MTMPRSLVAVALAGTLAGSGCGSVAASAATVNGRAINRAEFEQELASLHENLALNTDRGDKLRGSSSATVDPRLASQWLTSLIYDALISDAFEERGLAITDADRAATTDELEKELGGPDILKAFPDWFRDRLSGRTARSGVLRQSFGDLSPDSEEDLVEYYDEHKDDYLKVCVSHVLVESKAEADAALARITAGEDFASVARSVSKDTTTKEKGGDLGCEFANKYPKPFAKAALAATIGKPTGPVKTDFGYDVLRVDSRPYASFESVRTKVQLRLRGELNKRFSEYLTKAAKKAEINVDPRYGQFRLEPPGAPAMVPPLFLPPADGRPEFVDPGLNTPGPDPSSQF